MKSAQTLSTRRRKIMRLGLAVSTLAVALFVAEPWLLVLRSYTLPTSGIYSTAAFVGEAEWCGKRAIPALLWATSTKVGFDGRFAWVIDGLRAVGAPAHHALRHEITRKPAGLERLRLILVLQEAFNDYSYLGDYLDHLRGEQVSSFYELRLSGYFTRRCGAIPPRMTQDGDLTAEFQEYYRDHCETRGLPPLPNRRGN